MISNRRQRTAKALVAMALDRGDKPEGKIARQKLLALINRNPELITYPPIVALAQSDLGFSLPANANRLQRPHRITMQDIRAMRKAGIDVSGSWTASSLQEAITKAAADLQQRFDSMAQAATKASAAAHVINIAVENMNGAMVDITKDAFFDA